jgi:hypothetical protein
MMQAFAQVISLIMAIRTATKLHDRQGIIEPARWQGQRCAAPQAQQKYSCHQGQSRRVLERRLDVLAIPWRHIYG